MVMIEKLEERRVMSAALNPALVSPMLVKFAEQAQAKAVTVDAKPPKAGRFVLSFYGLGGAGSSFGQDYLENVADKTGDAKRATVRKYNEDEGNTALSELLTSLDTSGDHIISKTEANKASIRLVGYSFGGVAAINFARDLNKAGQTLQGFQLQSAIKVRSLVALDPVNHNGRHTNGVSANVNRFYNYYQLHGGDTTVEVYIKVLGKKIHIRDITVNDPSDIKGDVITSQAKHNSQIRVDTKWANKSATHSIAGAKAQIKGKNVNHGTLPFFVQDDAVSKLKK